LEQHNVWSVWPTKVRCTVLAGGKQSKAVQFSLACKDEQSKQCSGSRQFIPVPSSSLQSRAFIYSTTSNIIYLRSSGKHSDCGKAKRLPLSSDFNEDINSRNPRTTAIGATQCLERLVCKVGLYSISVWQAK